MVLCLGTKYKEENNYQQIQIQSGHEFDLHEFDMHQFIGVDSLHPKVPNYLEDSLTKSVTALKGNEGVGKWKREKTTSMIQSG